MRILKILKHQSVSCLLTAKFGLQWTGKVVCLTKGKTANNYMFKTQNLK